MCDGDLIQLRMEALRMAQMTCSLVGDADEKRTLDLAEKYLNFMLGITSVKVPEGADAPR